MDFVNDVERCVHFFPIPVQSAVHHLQLFSYNWSRTAWKKNSETFIACALYIGGGKFNLRHTLQCCSSLLSPHPSRPEQTIAVERHRPLPHWNGQ